MRALARTTAPLVMGIGLFVARATATPPPTPLTLDWSGPEGCGRGDRLRSQVDRILGASGPYTPLAARVAVTRPGVRWHLALSMTSDGRTSVRELDAESCVAVTAAAAVIVALTIESHAPATPDPEPGDAGTDAEVDPGAEAGAHAAGAPSAPPPPPDEAEVPPPDIPSAAPATLPFFVHASGLGSLGVLPRAAAGFGAGLGFAHGPLRVEAFAEDWPAVSRALADASSRGGAFRAWSAGARVCGMHDATRVSLGLCGGWSFTAMHAEAYGVTIPLSAGTTWSSVRGEALLVAPLSRVFALRADLSAIVPFARPVFEVEGEGVVFRPSGIAAELGVGAEAHF